MDKSKLAHPSKNIKSKRSSVISTASTSRKMLPCKNKNTSEVSKVNKNIIGDGDYCKTDTMPHTDMYNQVSYGKFLRSMLDDCLVDEKIVREETQIDTQMAQLADRFQKTMDQLDKTNRRLKGISFVVEQKRLLDLKNQDCNTLYNITDNSNVDNVLNDVEITEEACLDRLETKNVDFGNSNQSGHKQLLDAIDDAIDGFDQIKKHSNLDINKFKEYERSHSNLDQLEKDRFDLESLKSEFETKFPKFSEKLLKDLSEKIASVMNDNDDNEEDTD